MSRNANRRDDDVSRAVRFLLYDRSGLGRESLRSKQRQAQSVSARTRSRKRRVVTLPHVSLLDKPYTAPWLYSACRQQCASQQLWVHVDSRPSFCDLKPLSAVPQRFRPRRGWLQLWQFVHKRA